MSNLQIFYQLLNSRFYPRWVGATLLGFLVSLFWIEIGERGEIGVIEGMIGGTIIGLTQGLILSYYLSDAWLWILVNLISWGVLTGVGFGAMGWFTPHNHVLIMRFFWGLIFGAVGGAWLGIWQWLILKNFFQPAWYWIIFSSLSWALGLSLGWTLGGILRAMTQLFIGDVIGLVITWIIVGLITGLGILTMSQTKLLNSIRLDIYKDE